MLDFQLKIYLGLYDKAVEKVVKEAPLPEAVQAEIFLFSDYKNNIPENVTAVFITDKISLLRSALALRKKNLRIVYCGHAEDVGKLLNKLEALWPAGEKTEIIKKRFMILIKNLKNEFYAWFYQNALLTNINSLPFPMLILSADRKVVRMNRAFEKLFGYKAQDAENFDYQNWKKENMTSVNDETSKQETRSEIQKYYIQCNADTKQLIAREQEICDAFNNVSGYFLIVQEIT